MIIGDRIRLIHTSDPYTDLKPGDCGTVSYVGANSKYGDPMQVGVKWDGGSTLGMVVGEDRFAVIKDDE